MHPKIALPRQSCNLPDIAEREDLAVIPGMVPDLLHLPRGCRFADRCTRRQARCDEELPELDGGADSPSRVACFHPY